MQVDAEEDDHAFYKPPVEPSIRSQEIAANPQTVPAAGAEDDDE